MRFVLEVTSMDKRNFPKTISVTGADGLRPPVEQSGIIFVSSPPQQLIPTYTADKTTHIIMAIRRKSVTVSIAETPSSQSGSDDDERPQKHGYGDSAHELVDITTKNSPFSAIAHDSAMKQADRTSRNSEEEQVPWSSKF